MPLRERYEMASPPTILERLARDERLLSDAASLAADYTRDFPSVRRFFDHDYRTLDQLLLQAQAELEDKRIRNIDRRALVARLAPYMRSLGASKAARAALRNLAAPDSLVVVAGQQPVIAGGPLLLLYKCAHAIRTARALRERGVNAVAVFWIASEDHDFAESARFCAVAPDGKIRNWRMRDGAGNQTAPLEILRLPDPESPEAAALADGIGPGPLREEALRLLRSSLGATFGRGLARLLLRVFADEELVVLEPRLLRGLEAYKNVIRHEIRHATRHRLEVDAVMDEQRADGYLPVLQPSPHLGFFLIARGRRRHVSLERGEFLVDGMEALSKAELLALCDASPERFSTGVRLRPIAQSACLPTLAAVLGPAEISYFSALGPLFRSYGMRMPALLPRWSFVLASGRPVTGIRDLLKQGSLVSRQATAAIQEVDNETRLVIEQMRRDLGVLARPLGPDIEHIQGGIAKSLHELRGRIMADPLAGSDPARKDDARWLYPEHRPQERVVSWLSLWPTWGERLKSAFAERDAFDFTQAVM